MIGGSEAELLWREDDLWPWAVIQGENEIGSLSQIVYLRLLPLPTTPCEIHLLGRRAREREPKAPQRRRVWCKDV